MHHYLSSKVGKYLKMPQLPEDRLLEARLQELSWLSHDHLGIPARETTPEIWAIAAEQLKSIEGHT